jgi:stromal membrane-associated protein
MGDLFDMSAPAPPPKPAPITSTGFSAPASNYSSSAFNLSQPTQPSAAKPAAVQSSNFSGMSNMDAWGSSDAWATPDSPAPAPTKAAPPPQVSAPSFKSAPAPPAPVMNDFDSGWGDSAPAAKPAVATPGTGWGDSSASVQPATTSSAGGFSVQQDEEFGGWSHASPVATTPGAKQGGMGGNSDDLFGNVWG